MILNGRQIRAARARLDWDLQALSNRSGVKFQMISAIENGRSEGSLDTLTRLATALALAGIEPTEQGGVQPRQGRILTFSGHKGFCAFFDDMYETAKNHPMPDLVHMNVKEDNYSRWLGSYSPIHIKRMSELGGYRVRALLKVGDQTVTASEYAEYRWLPADQFADVSIYYYGDKSAFIDFSENDVQVTVVDNPSVTRALRKSFEVVWASSFKHPDGKKNR